MTEWEPATEAESAMRDALRMSDQEQYFRILGRTELLLPVSADALAGRAPMGWGTWNSGGRTHVLAFTSPEAMRVCLAENAGSARKIAYHELAKTWPNHEWWLAVNPGLPIEGYLPPWFVSQLSRGDVRLPGRTSARARAVAVPPLANAGTPTVDKPSSYGPDGHARGSVSATAGGTPTATGSSGSATTAGTAAPSGTAPVSGSAAAGGTAASGGTAKVSRPATFGSAAAEAVGGLRAAMATRDRGSGRSSTFGRSPDPLPPTSPAPPAQPTGSDRSGDSGAAAPPDAHAAPSDPAGPAVSARIIDDAEVVTGPAATARRTAARTPDGRPDRRPKRLEASIIDAEIIESTVLGRTALDATVVSATVVESVVDAAVIDAEVIDARVDDPAANARRTPPTIEAPPKAKAEPFAPANEVEENLLDAVGNGKTDSFLSTLLLAKVLIPIPTGEKTDVRPDSPVFPWRREVFDGQPYLVVFTSSQRMREFMRAEANHVTARFVQLIRHWPDVNWAFAVNPGSPVGATLPGAQVKALSLWAEGEGLTDDEPDVVIDEPAPPPRPATIVMQKPVAPSQVAYYLERGYDRVSGFVHRAIEVAHLRTPDQIYAGLGLSYSGTPFDRDAAEIYVLRWAAHRGDLYRIPYGGQHEAAMRAMQGWMIERAPFRGNGFAPAERGEVIAEFKVDSIRLPHGAQMWRLTSSGERSLVAVLDADECQWRSASDAGIEAEWDPTAPPQRNRAALARYQAPPPREPERPDPADDPLDPRWRPARTGGR